MKERSGSAMARRRFLRLLAGGALGVGGTALAGCGGGGSGGGGGGTGMDPDTRMAAIAAVEAALPGIWALGLGKDQHLQAIATLLAGRAEYEASGAEPEFGCAWGRFTDGRLHVVSANRTPDPDIDFGPSRQAPPPATRVTPAWIPRSTQARLLHSFGTNFGASQVPIDDIARWLTASGYQVVPSAQTSQGDARVDKLRQVQGDGFFYLNTHGGHGKLRPDGPDEAIFCLQSSTLVDAALERVPQYADDLQAQRLVYLSGLNGLVNSQGQPLTDTRYAITYLFVRRYWSFSPDSVVTFNVCYSGNPDASTLFFRSACQDKGAGVVFGWSEAVDPSSAFRSIRYMVSRLIGDDQKFQPENPPQRPFDWQSILADMGRKGYDTATFPDGTVSKLIGFPKGAQSPHLLTPAIEQLRFDPSTGNMHLLGQFGAVQGKVSVGGFDRPVVSWAPDKVVCDVPTQGDGSFGPVLAQVDNRKSNLRYLTRWVLTLQTRFHYPDFPPQLAVTGPVTITLRGDIGEYRTEAGKAPIVPIRPAYPTPDGKAVLTAAGTAAKDGCTYTWSGSATFPVMTGTPGANGEVLGAMMEVDTSSHTGYLGLSVGVFSPPFTQTGACPGSPTMTARFSSSFGLLDDENHMFQNPLTLNHDRILPALVVGFNNDWALQAGAYHDPLGFVDITWSLTAAEAAPPDNAQR